MTEPLDRDALARACETLPIFPLPNVVLLPHTIMPLHVFEERYRAMMRHALGGDRLLVVPTLATGWEADYEGRPAVHPVAGLGRIVQHRLLPDGRYNIAVLGIGRVRIEAEHPLREGYRVVQARLLSDELPAGREATLHTGLEQVRALLARLLMLYPRLKEDLSCILEPRTPTAAMLDPLAHLLIQDPEDRQQYLEEDRPLARVDCVLEGLAGVIARASSNAPEA